MSEDRPYITRRVISGDTEIFGPGVSILMSSDVLAEACQICEALNMAFNKGRAKAQKMEAVVLAAAIEAQCSCHEAVCQHLEFLWDQVASYLDSEKEKP